MAARRTDGQREVLLATKAGMIIRFPEEEVRPMGRTAPPASVASTSTRTIRSSPPRWSRRA